MRLIVAPLACVVACCLLASCSTAGLMVGDAPVTGRVRDVSINDIHQAMAAARKAPQHRGKYYEIEIQSSNEIYLYYSPAVSIGPENPSSVREYDVVRRQDGKWRLDGGGMVRGQFFPTGTTPAI